MTTMHVLGLVVVVAIVAALLAALRVRRYGGAPMKVSNYDYGTVQRKYGVARPSFTDRIADSTNVEVILPSRRALSRPTEWWKTDGEAIRSDWNGIEDELARVCERISR